MTTLPKTCLSVDAAAEYLGVSALTVRRLISAKKLKASRIGRRVIITPAALAKFLEESEAP
jgi:excisionase family DNA binding protein